MSFRFAIESIFQENRRYGDFPGDPVVKTCCFQCNTAGFVPGEGTKIPHTMRCCQENVKKEEVEDDKEDFVITKTDIPVMPDDPSSEDENTAEETVSE